MYSAVVLALRVMVLHTSLLNYNLTSQCSLKELPEQFTANFYCKRWVRLDILVSPGLCKVLAVRKG